MMFDGNSEGARFILRQPLPPAAYSALDDVDDNMYPGDGGGGDGDDGALVDSDATEAGASELNPIFKPVPCDDVAEIVRELGVPGPRHKCFACMYVGQNRGAKIPDQRLAGVFQTMSDGIGESWPPALAVQVAKQYESWRKIINATRGDREKLPKWTAASILDHWFTHTCDPEIQQWLHLMMLQYTIFKIRATGLERVNVISGVTKHDKDQWMILQSAIRLWYTVSAKEPRKLSYFHEGAMIDRKSLSNGGISRKRRPIFQFFGKSKRTRAVSGGDAAE